MDKVLLVAHGEKQRQLFEGLLKEQGLEAPYSAISSSEARKLLRQHDFALVIIISPLPEEYGVEVAKAAVETTAGVMVVVKNDVIDDMTERLQGEGIFVFSPGMGKKMFRQSVNLLLTLHQRLAATMPRQKQLEQKIEDIRIIDRAKCLLIQYEGMAEEEAHRLIEKQAMDQRITRREMAERVLKGYEL